MDQKSTSTLILSSDANKPESRRGFGFLFINIFLFQLLFTVVTQWFPWVQQCTATLKVTRWSHLRNKFTEIFSGHWPFFAFHWNTIWIFTLAGFFFFAILYKKLKVRNIHNIHHPKSNYSNWLRDKTQNKASLRESVTLKRTVEKRQSGAECFTTSSFQLTWESQSPSMFWHCGVKVSSGQRFFQSRCERASVELSRRLPAATCLFATLLLGLCHLRFSPFFFTSLAHTKRLSSNL